MPSARADEPDCKLGSQMVLPLSWGAQDEIGLDTCLDKGMAEAEQEPVPEQA